MKAFRIFTFILFLSIVFPSFSQTLDEGFQLPIPIRAAGIGTVKVQDDGKILVGGGIQFFENQRVNNLIRLNEDGTLDETFSFTPDSLQWISHIGLLSNGEIIVSGPSTLMKLSSSGQILHEVDSIKDINSINIQGDDKIVVTVSKIYTGKLTGSLYRFNSDLTFDESFNQTNSFNGWIFDAALQGDKIIVSGNFSEVNGTVKNDLARFESDGNLDHSFDTGSGTSDFVMATTVQPDGKLLIVGNIGSFNGTNFNYTGIIRLNIDGAVDPDFNADNRVGGTESKPVLQGSDILIGGYLYANDLPYGDYVYRLKSNGDFDASFTPISGKYLIASAISGDIIINNSHRTGNEYGLSKFSKEGQWDQTFNPELGTFGEINKGDYHNDQMVIGGKFIRIGEVRTRNLAKINSEGTVDADFIIDPSITAYGAANLQPTQIKIIDDDTIFVALGNKLVKLNAKGEVDEQFISQGITDPSWFVSKFNFKENKIVASDGNGVFMLNADGEQDLSFNTPKFDVSSSAYDCDIQSTGIIFASNFTKVNDLNINGFVRLNFDGSVDQTFDAGSGGKNLWDINVIENDEILATGFFEQFNGVATRGLVRLSSNGQVDKAFTSNYNTTAPEGFSSGFYNTTFRDGFMISAYGTKGYTLGFLNADGTFNADYRLPDEITRVEKRIIPIVVNADSVMLLSRFHVNGNPDPSFVLRLIFNDRPTITGTTSPLSTPEETPLELTLNELIITDEDSTFPDDFTLSIHAGDHYTVEGSQIIPDKGFNGNLTVPVVVNDGKNESDIFNLTVEVTPVEDTPDSINVVISGDTGNDSLVSITFSEKVDDFQLSDITVSSGTVSDLITEDSISFTAVVTPASDGSLTLFIPADVVKGKAGNTNKASEVFNRIFEVEKYFTLTVAIDKHNQAEMPSLTATLYEKENGRFVVVAEQEISGTSSLSFEELPAGEYTVGIKPAGTDFFPAYLGDKLMLLDATTITLHQDTLQTISLLDKPENNAVGESVISGVLLRSTETGNGRILTGNATKAGEALANIPLYLMHPQTGEILAHAVTDEQGKFSFTGLQTGAYLFAADYEGLPADEEQNIIDVTTDFETVTVTAIAGENIRIAEVQTEKQITAVEEDILQHRVQYYPNPVTDDIFIELDASWINGEIRISDASGKLLKTQSIVSDIMKLSLEKMNTGIYIITVSKDDVYHSFRVFKQ